MTGLQTSAMSGLNDLFGLHEPIVTYLLLMNLVLIGFIVALLRDAKSERKLNRDAFIDSTKVLTRLEELHRHDHVG